MNNRDAAVSLPHVYSIVTEGSGGNAAAFSQSSPGPLGAGSTIAADVTTFSGIPSNANTTYQSLAPGFAAPAVLQQTDIAGTGWDVSAQAGNNAAAFAIRGIGTPGNGDGDNSSIRFQASDVDYVVFQSNASGFHFDLNTFSLRNAATSSLTVQALDADGVPTGSAVPFTVTGGSGPFTQISLTGNTDFVGIYGFKVTFGTATDAPFFDNLVVANIGIPGPPATTVAHVALGNDTGSSASDFVTREAVQTISGTLSAPLAAGETVEVSFDGGVNWSDAGTFAVGSDAWSTGAMLAGTQVFLVRVANGYGGGDAYSHDVTLDTLAPDAPSTDLAPGSAHVTNQAAAPVTGHAEIGSTVTLYDSDGTTVLGTDTADDGTWSIVPTLLAQGSHNVTATAADLAGNVSTASAALTLTLDTEAPSGLALSATSVPAAAAGSGAAVATLSSSDVTAVTYALSPGDGSDDANNALFAIGGTTLSVGAAGLDPGTYRMHLSATDAAGNVSQLAETITVAGGLEVTSIVREGGVGAGLAAGTTSTAYTVTFSDSVTGVDTGDFSLTGSGTASGHIAAVSGDGATYTVTVDALAGDGALRLDLNAGATGIRDLAGVDIGDGYTGGQAYVLDHTAPGAPAALDPAPGSDHVINRAAPVITGTAETGSTVTLYDSDGTTVLGTDTAVNGAWSITPAALAQGGHSLVATAVDGAGNVSAASAALLLTVDTEAPAHVALSSHSVAVGAAVSGAPVATLSSSDRTEVTYALVEGDGDNDAENASFTIAGNALSVGGHALEAGIYHVYVSATDAAGNVTYSAQTVAVSDAPAVASIVRADGAAKGLAATDATAWYTVTFSEAVSGVDADDFVLEASGSAGGRIATVSGSGTTYTVAVDSLNGDGTLRLDLSAGATGIVGPGNVAIAGGYTEGQIYVLDHTAPATPAAPVTLAPAPDGIVNVTAPTLHGSAEAGAVVTLYDIGGATVLGTVTAADGTWSITPAALAQGSHLLGVTAVDAAGNVSLLSAPLALTVDTEAPAHVELSNNVVAVGAAGSGAAVATLSSSDSTAVTYALVAGNGSNDSDNARFTIVGNTLSVGGSALETGKYHLYLAATDAAGNVTHVAQSIAVRAVPAVSSIVRADGAAAGVTADAASTAYTVTFSEAVSGVDAADFTLTASGSAAGRIASVGGSGTIYTVTVDSLAGDGTLRLDLNAAATGIRSTGNIAIDAGYTAGQAYVLDHTAPGAPAAIALLEADDTGVSHTDAITAVAAPRIAGTGEAYATVRLLDGDGVTVLGSTTADAGGAWQIASSALADGVHDLRVHQADAAGNVSAPGAALRVTIDATGPAAPGAPVLSPASDSGVKGDGTTTVARPTLAGHGEALAAITLLDTDGTTVVGTTHADAEGNWSVNTAALSLGHHVISARQTDAAGNVSATGPALALTIAAAPPTAPSAPAPTTVDGVQVSHAPVTLPGGASGMQTTIPIVTSDRVDSAGSHGVADIPLVTAGGATLLLAQLGVDMGLTVTGGASEPAATAGERLVQAILAATPGHSAGDQGHLTGNGQSFLDLLPTQVPLLVQTVTPVSASRAAGAPLTLTGTSTAEQHTALVIDAGGFGHANTLALKDVDFAAVIGAATVTSATHGVVLTGDAAAQTFVVDAGLGSKLFAGGGDDTLRFTAGMAVSDAAGSRSADAAAGPLTLVNGGMGSDTVSFAGARSAYTVDVHDGHLVVTANGGAHEQAYVVNAETLQFADASVTVDTRGAVTALAGLYADVLGRQADVGGIEFWSGYERSGATLGRIALDMIATQEGQARHHAFDGDAAHDVAILYGALFGRQPDAAGAAWWTAAMHAGATLEQVADAFMHAPEIVAHRVGATGWDFTY